MIQSYEANDAASDVALLVSFVLWERQDVSHGMETCKEGNAEGVVGIYHCLTRDGLMIYRLDRNVAGKKGRQFSFDCFIATF